MWLADQFQGQKVKGQGHRPTNADTRNVPYLPNGKAQELQSWCADGRRRPAPAASAMISKVKGQGHKVTWYVWPVWAILRNLHLALWQTTTTRMTDNRSDLQGQRSRS